MASTIKEEETSTWEAALTTAFNISGYVVNEFRYALYKGSALIRVGTGQCLVKHCTSEAKLVDEIAVDTFKKLNDLAPIGNEGLVGVDSLKEEETSTWEAALTTAFNISGYVVNEFRYALYKGSALIRVGTGQCLVKHCTSEAKLVDEIAVDTFKKLNDLAPIGNEGLVGVDSLKEEETSTWEAALTTAFNISGYVVNEFSLVHSSPFTSVYQHNCQCYMKSVGPGNFPFIAMT
ncbi:hypothetical protein YC2023_107530 [Brassica napus]